MKKKSWLICLIAIMFLTNIWLFTPQRTIHAVEEAYEQIRLLVSIMNIIQEQYVEPVETKKLIYGAASGMMRTLDPFSQFMEPDLHKEMKTETEGEFGGLGIRIAIKDNILTVVTPLPGTPAYRLGVLPGDKIIKIEGETTEGITVMDAVKKLRGTPGTKVNITIAREGAKEPIELSIVREIIKIESARSEMLDADIGYIWIIEFTAKTLGDLDTALRDLQAKGMKSLVLDLRNDPGGLLTEAVNVCKRFIDGNKLIVYTQGRRPEQRQEFRADNTSAYSKIPMIVLVNKGSASGSEIVAGAMQDLKRAVIVGSTTFGKGSVQSVIPLPDASALRLTTAKYYTPSGKCIHDKGIKPDIVIEVPIESEQKLRAQKELIYSKDKSTESIIKKEDRVEDMVLLRATELLKAREILTSVGK